MNKGWKRPRDTQRARLYKADDALKPFASPLREVEDIQRFIRHVWSLKRVQESWPRAFDQSWPLPLVQDGRGRRSACGSATGINIPRWARTSDVVLHELAHCITDREWGSIQTPGHGWHFCKTFLRLVLLVMGREAHNAFKASMKVHGVRFTRPRAKVSMSPERKAQLAIQLAEARARRSGGQHAD